MRNLLKTGVLSLVFILIGFFNNCSSYNSEEGSAEKSSSGNNTNSTDFVDADYLKTDKPNLLCGEEGYEYLLNEYFRVHCAVCHEKGGDFSPAFADPVETTDSYFAARYIDREVFLNTITNNSFCGKECSLNKEGETYKAIVEWLDNKWVCPTE
jgi:hypothetical protein